MGNIPRPALERSAPTSQGRKHSAAMPSRKKTKGRERKARAAEAEDERRRKEWQSLARGSNLAVACDHGRKVTTLPGPDHPVCKFMDRFWKPNYEENGTIATFASGGLMDTLIRECGEVWLDNYHRKCAVDLLTRIGTNVALLTDCDAGVTKIDKVMWRGEMFQAIVLLENYDGCGLHSTFVSQPAVIRKCNDLKYTRDALKFLSKRISCSCLKDMYSWARKEFWKLGLCHGCREEKERNAMLVCSRCAGAEYCCRKCQVDHWPRHKVVCDDAIATRENKHRT